MIKVVHLITSLGQGGAQTMLSRLLAGMDRTRIDNVVISLTGQGPVAMWIRAQGVPVTDLDNRRGVPGRADVWRLWRLLRRERPHVLQTWLYHADLIGLLVGKLARVPAIAWNVRCAETDARYRSGRNGAVVRLLAHLSRQPDAVVVNSRAGRRLHQELGYRPRRWEVMPNGFDVDLFRPDSDAGAALRRELGLAPEHLLIGLVARYDPLKDQENFLRAATIYRRHNAAARFIMGGDGIDDGNARLTCLIRELGIADRVHLLGERSDIPVLTAGFDIATCASCGEGFPNVVGEAMACAVPCAATDVGDTAIILAGTGRVVPPKNPAALAAAWAELAALGPEGRRDLGRRARESVVDRYSIGAVAASYQDFYASLCKGRQPERRPKSPLPEGRSGN
ncbi:MAG: glycosyltransferase [Kiloniellaceae bacterium]